MFYTCDLVLPYVLAVIIALINVKYLMISQQIRLDIEELLKIIAFYSSFEHILKRLLKKVLAFSKL